MASVRLATALLRQPTSFDRTETAPSREPSSCAVPPRLLPPGTRLTADYEITGVLGEGGMAVVYRGRDRRRGREVAIKMLHANLLGNRALRGRFRREATLMQAWRHQHVIEVYELLDDDRVFAQVMERVDGPTLDEHLRQRGPLEPGELAALFAPILSAMASAHRRGVVHRDLKPTNVLLAPGPTPKVSDFGIAKAADGADLTETGSLLGSCRYMAPEQAQCAAHVDHRADIYSLGVMMYVALTGAYPFDGPGPLAILMAHMSQTPPPPSALNPALDSALDRLVLSAMARDPAARPASCDELAAGLAQATATAVPSSSWGRCQ